MMSHYLKEVCSNVHSAKELNQKDQNTNKGNVSRDQTEPTPFVIEWIPDILPVSKIGELRIRFEFGHQRNGQLEKKAAALAQRAYSKHAATHPPNTSSSEASELDEVTITRIIGADFGVYNP